jgi:protein-disulfide isomerase
MTEDKPTTATDAQSGVGVPVAIVLAGALIAGAIYFGGSPIGKGVIEEVNEPTAAAVQPADDGQVAGVVVGDLRPVDEKDHVRGSANAKVTIIEYSDIECPFCKRFHPTIRKVLDAYPNDVRWVYRHFPLEQLHPNAKVAALATECAAEQGKFWEMLDYLMEKVQTGEELAEDKLPALAQKAGVAGVSQFTTCLSSKKYEARIASDMQDAAVAGGQGTPYSVIIGSNGEKEPLSGAQPYEAVKAAVDKYL